MRSVRVGNEAVMFSNRPLTAFTIVLATAGSAESVGGMDEFEQKETGEERKKKREGEWGQLGWMATDGQAPRYLLWYIITR